VSLYRGTGGATSVSGDASIEQVLQYSTEAQAAAAAAAASQSAASSSASAASTSEGNAATSETNAAASESAAAASEAAAAASYDSFDDRYLGAKSSAPTLDNDGNALLTGALYWNSTTDKMYVWSGSAWNTSLTNDGSGVDITGTLTADVFDINSGTIDGTTIGASSPTTGVFTTLQANTSLTSASVIATNLSASGTTTLAGASTTADITFGDNNKAIFGAGSDLQIYHDGSNSYISDQGFGSLRILSDGFSVKNNLNNETMIAAQPNSGVTLYYDNAAKLTTTSTGVDVTGTATMDGLVVDGDASVITLNNTDTGLSLDQKLAEIKINQNDPSDQGVGTVASIEVVNRGTIQGIGKFNFKTGSATSLANRLSIGEGGDISFYEDTGTTAKFFWDASAESLGIGSGSPRGGSNTRLLSAKDSGTNYIEVQTDSSSVGGLLLSDGNTGNYGAIQYDHGGDCLQLYTAATERMRITPDGHLLVGKSATSTFNAGHYLTPGGQLGITSVNATSGSANLICRRDTTDGIFVGFNKDNTTVGSIGTSNSVGFSTTYMEGVANSSGLLFGNNEILPHRNGARVDGSMDIGDGSYRFKDLYLSGGVYGNSNALKFSTDAGTTQHMTLDTSGNLLVNATSTTFSEKMKVDADGTLYALHLKQNSTDAQGQVVFSNANGAVGTIFTNGTTTYYNTSSDYRLKEDWQPIANASTDVMALKPCNFAWKFDGSRVNGFLAHELAEVIPEAVTGEKDAVDDEGNPVYQGIDQSKLVPLLTAALQEALAKIETLEARLTNAGL